MLTQNKQTLIFLPGYGFHASVWETVAAEFSDYDVQLTELPALDAENHSRQLQEFADALPAGAALIGWSLGGLIAIECCLLFPEKFSGLVLTASSPRFLEENDWRGISRDSADNFIELSKNNEFDYFHKIITFPGHSRKILRFLQKHTLKHIPLVFYLDHLLQTDLRKQYNSLTMPKLSISGEHDAVLPVQQPDIMIPDAGHAPFLSHTHDYCNAVKNFLSGLHDAK